MISRHEGEYLVYHGAAQRNRRAIAIEEVIEMLESDQLLLQTMPSGRHNFFQQQTELWFQHLMTVSEVIGILNEIQRAWAYLEPRVRRSETRVTRASQAVSRH
jgi:hypothetical protein